MRRRWLLLGAAAVAGAAVLCAGVYDRTASPGRWVPGTYTGVRVGGKGTTILRLARDGSGVWENEVPPGSAAPPPPAVTGRWRLSGRVFMFESGATASEPVGVFQPLAERFDSPILMPELFRARLVSADATALVFDLGGVEWRLLRVAAP